MNARAEIWNVLHDGEITAIQGHLPGSLRLRINIAYLRQMFSADGEDIYLDLVNCTTFRMTIWNDSVTTDDLQRIASTGTEILSTESDDTPAHIITTLGELDVAFESFSLTLDNGKAISYEDLVSACDRYWHRWEELAMENRKKAEPPARPYGSPEAGSPSGQP